MFKRADYIPSYLLHGKFKCLTFFFKKMKTTVNEPASEVSFMFVKVMHCAITQQKKWNL